ncbi:MAG: type VII secretion-associated serine protease mycosin [Mycobacteriaceae bacterium]|nr:type VII secretion-associated serine protease mycosin [Mycobacteriaceae bacterium]
MRPVSNRPRTASATYVSAWHTLRRLTVIALVALAGLSSATARAVAPPPIDQKWLPQPAAPAPPQPTVQRDMCTPASASARLSRSAPSPQLAQLGLAQVWSLTRGAGQRVAVIDTGVAPHQRLPKLVGGGDYVSTGDGTQDCDGHGTVVAGIIAAASSPADDSFSGVAPEATIISIRQSSTKFAAAADRSGSGFGDVETMAKAVRTAADLGASVINISAIACVPVGSGLDDRALGAALAYAVDTKNAVVVAAAGNTGGADQCPPQQSPASWDTVTVAVSPAWYDDYVLTVGSVTVKGAPSTFTLAGPWLDVAAPGEAVISLSTDGKQMVKTLGTQNNSTGLQGTSYAAPVVSGLAALIRARFPTMTARQVMQRIKTTAQHPPDGWDPFVGNGIIDAYAAVSTDSAPRATDHPPAGAAPPSAAPPPPAPADRRSRQVAFTGTAICIAALVMALSGGAVTRRLARSRHNGIPGH